MTRGKLCPRAGFMGAFACADAAQCWEPCGDLGKSMAHARRADETTHRAIEEAIGARHRRGPPLKAEPLTPAEDADTFDAMVAVVAILNGVDTGIGTAREPWETIRQRLVRLVRRYAFLRTRDVTVEGVGFVSYVPELGHDGSRLDALIDEAIRRQDGKSRCPWCGLIGVGYDETPRPADVCEHDNPEEG